MLYAVFYTAMTPIVTQIQQAQPAVGDYSNLKKKKKKKMFLFSLSFCNILLLAFFNG